MKDGQPWTAAAPADGIRGRGLPLGGDAAKRYIQVDLARAVNIASDDFTVAFWFKTTAPGGVLLGSTTSAPYWQVHTRDIGGKIQPAFMMNAGGGRATSLGLFPDASEAVSDGAWHHYAFAVDRGRNVRLYRDGTFAGAMDIAGHTGPLKQVLSVGGPYGHPTGVMDEFCVFQGAFDADAAARLYREYGVKR